MVDLDTTNEVPRDVPAIMLPHDVTDEAAAGIGDGSHRHHCARQPTAPHSGVAGSSIPVTAPEGGHAQRKGRVQSAIVALFRAQPDRVFSAVDLAQAIHGQATRTTCKTIRRAADRVAGEMGWTRRRMWGRVDYVRPETLNAITRHRAEKAAQLMELSY